MVMMKRIVLVFVVAAVLWLALEEKEMTTGIGLPDWGRIKKDVGVSPLSDLGELAARLGSINTYDRRGDTVWMDDFEDGIIKWSTDTLGTGAAVASSSVYARNGAKSAKLTGGSDEDRYALITHRVTPLVLSKVGFECSFNHSAAVQYVEWWLHYFNGTTIYHFAVRFSKVDGKLYYPATAYTWTAFATVAGLFYGPIPFHTCKLVADPVALKYVRFLLDETEYDLSAYAPWSEAASGTPYWEGEIKVVSLGNQNGVVYVDDVIITQNEP